MQAREAKRWACLTEVCSTVVGDENHLPRGVNSGTRAMQQGCLAGARGSGAQGSLSCEDRSGDCVCVGGVCRARLAGGQTVLWVRRGRSREWLGRLKERE